MLTENSSVSDRKINGSIDTVKNLDMRLKTLFCTIYVKIDDPEAGNSLKDVFVTNWSNMWQLPPEQRGTL